MSGIKARVHNIMATAFTAIAADSAVDGPMDPLVHTSQHADFQADAAMRLAKQLKRKPRDIAADVIAAIESDGLFEAVELAGPGFINITLTDQSLGDSVMTLREDQRLGVDLQPSQVVVVDYSSPNVAKEMHVGHLRSTIIGDACVRLLEWLGHNVIRRNHVGDWGTPFGMLIEHLLDLGEVAGAQTLSQGDLNSFYRAARGKFDESVAFQGRARSRVVALQSGDAETLRLWKILIEQSERYFVSVYKQMDVRLDGTEFVGESAYNDDLLPTLEELARLGLIAESDGAQCLFPDGFTNREDKPLPLIVQKSDGGYGYAATDLAAIRDRTQNLGANRILYVVGAPQQQHLQMIYRAAQMAGWLRAPASAEHVSFGSVLGADGKMFKSRSGDNTKLGDLLTEAVNRAAITVAEKNPDLGERDRSQVARAVGVGAVKYADLSTERTKDYVFDIDRMLAFEGNTGPYTQFAHARIHSILRQAGRYNLPENMQINTPEERALALQLLCFADIAVEVSESLLFHRLADYLFDLATLYSGFYTNCPVLKAEDEITRGSRLVLCQVTGQTLATGLSLLGILAPQQM